MCVYVYVHAQSILDPCSQVRARESPAEKAARRARLAAAVPAAEDGGPDTTMHPPPATPEQRIREGFMGLLRVGDKG